MARPSLLPPEERRRLEQPLHQPDLSRTASSSRRFSASTMTSPSAVSSSVCSPSVSSPAALSFMEATVAAAADAYDGSSATSSPRSETWFGGPPSGSARAARAAPHAAAPRAATPRQASARERTPPRAVSPRLPRRGSAAATPPPPGAASPRLQPKAKWRDPQETFRPDMSSSSRSYRALTQGVASPLGASPGGRPATPRGSITETPEPGLASGCSALAASACLQSTMDTMRRQAQLWASHRACPEDLSLRRSILGSARALAPPPSADAPSPSAFEVQVAPLALVGGVAGALAVTAAEARKSLVACLLSQEREVDAAPRWQASPSLAVGPRRVVELTQWLYERGREDSEECTFKPDLSKSSRSHQRLHLGKGVPDASPAPSRPRRTAAPTATRAATPCGRGGRGGGGSALSPHRGGGAPGGTPRSGAVAAAAAAAAPPAAGEVAPGFGSASTAWPSAAAPSRPKGRTPMRASSLCEDPG